MAKNLITLSHRTPHIIMAALLSVATLTHCGPGRKAVWEGNPQATATEVTEAQDQAMTALKTQALGHWEQRSERSELEAAIAAWEKVLEQHPEDFETLTALSRAYYFLADGFIASSAEQGRILSIYETGIQYGERAMLASSEDFANAVKKDSRADVHVKLIPNEGQPAMYWYASNLGRFAVAKGFTTTLYYKDRIFAIMKRVLEIDPNFYYGAPHRYFGAYYAKAPSFAGGDMNKSKQHFETALKIAPDYLGTQVLYADYYATKKDDRKLYEKLLNNVLSADANIHADIIPEQNVEQKKAERFLAEANERF